MARLLRIVWLRIGKFQRCDEHLVSLGWRKWNERIRLILDEGSEEAKAKRTDMLSSQQIDKLIRDTRAKRTKRK
jgi:hypothetical protein